MRHAFDDPSPPQFVRLPRPRGEIDIDTGRRRRWFGRVGYWLTLTLAAIGFVLLFERLAGSRLVAVGAVAFMLAYMAIGAHLADRALRESNHSGGLG